jgi:hypothetical protein
MVCEPPSADPPLVLLCRDRGPRLLIERAAGPVQAYDSAMEALLAVARQRPRAVVLYAADFDGRQDAILSALRRAQPDVPVYVVVDAADEPTGRRLVEEGAADYAVMSEGLQDLREMLAGKAGPAQRLAVETEAYLAAGRAQARQDAPAASGPGRSDPSLSGQAPPGAQRFFDAACALAGLAALDPPELLEKGGRVIVEAAGAERGSVFVWDNQAGRLDRRGGGSADAPADDQQALAERAVRTGETLLVETGGGPVLCVPVRAGGDALGAVSLSGAALGGEKGAPVRAAVESLARALAHLAAARPRG